MRSFTTTENQPFFTSSFFKKLHQARNFVLLISLGLISWAGYTQAPPAPTAFVAGAATSSSLSFSWTTGGGSTGEFLIVRNTVNTFDQPTDGATYSVGNTVGSNGTVVGVQAGVSFNNNTGLSASTQYYYKIWGHKTSGGGEYSATGLAGTMTTTAAPPLFVSAKTLSLTSIEITFDQSITAITNANGSDFTSATFTATAATLSAGKVVLTVNALSGPGYTCSDLAIAVGAVTGTSVTNAAISGKTVADGIAPAAPSTPDLAAADDSGSSSTDNITSATTNLTFSGTSEANATIQLYDGASPIAGGSTTANGSGNWSVDVSLAAGATYSVNAKATDAAANTGTASGNLSVTIDTSAPAAPSTPDLAAADDSGSSNSDNVTSATTNLTFSGTSEANASIQLYDGASPIAGGATTADGSGNWTVDVSLAAGATYSVNAKATDAAGNTGTASGNLSVTIDTSAPAAPSTPDLAAADDLGSSNSDNLTSATTNLTFSGTSEANASIQLYDGASPIAGGATTADGSGNWTVDVSLSAGTYSVNAKATDAAGNTGTASGNLSVTIDTSAPAAPSTPDLAAADDSGSSNSDNITSATTNLTFSGTSEANASIQLYDGASPIAGGAATADGSGNWTVDVSLTAGATYSVNAKATDVAGNTGTASGNLSVTIDTSAPAAPSTPDLAAADDLGSSNSDNITSATTNLTFSGTSEANASIQLYDGASPIAGGATTANGSGNWTVDVSLAAGTYSVNAKATDAAGNTGTASGNLSVTIDTSAPAAPSTPDLAAADDLGSSNSDNITSATTNLTFSGTSEANASIQLYNGATPVAGGSTTANGSGNWTVDVNLSAGSYSINAIATDVAGNPGTASGNLSLTIDTTAPTVAITLANTNPSTATSLDFTVTFTESVTGVDITDFVLATGSANDATGTISNLSGSGAVYTVTVNTIVGQYTNGTNAILNLDIVGSPGIADAASNALTGSPTTDAQYSVDNTAPTVVLNDFTLNTNGTSAETIVFTVSEPLNGSLTNNITGFTIGNATGNGTTAPTGTYNSGNNTITLTNAGSDGTWGSTVTVTYTPGNVSDVLANPMVGISATTVTVPNVNLTAGDIAFTAVNTKGTPNGFSFVLLKNVPASTKIYFTANGWTGSALQSGETTVTWTSPNSVLNAGTEVLITGTGNGSNGLTVTGGGTAVSSVTGAGTSSLDLNSSGDQVLAYQGSSGSPTFIAAINASSDKPGAGTFAANNWNNAADVGNDANRSALPTGLTEGTNAISLSQLNSVNVDDNVQYKIVATGGLVIAEEGSAQQLRSAMCNTANWNEQDNTAYSASGVTYKIRPVITAVSIPNSNMLVGNTVTATITVHDDRGSSHTLLTSNIGGFTLGSLSRINSTTYTATFTIAEGGTDVAAGSNIPLSIDLQSAQGNSTGAAAIPTGSTSAVQVFTTAISQASDPIDAHSPYVQSINRQSSTNVWSATNGTSASSVVFRITFSENMASSTLTGADFSIPVTGGISGASVTNIAAVTGTSVFDITVGGYSGTGTLGLNYQDSEVNVTGASVNDLVNGLAGNPTKTSGGAADGSFTGQTFTIVKPEPNGSFTSTTASNLTGNSATITWSYTGGTQNPDNYLVLAKPTTGGTYPALEDFPDALNSHHAVANGNPVAGTFAKNVPFGTNTYTFSGLNSGTSYDFVVYPYTNTSDNIDYQTTATSNTATGSTITASLSWITLNSAALPISSSTNIDKTSGAQVMQFKIFDDGQNPLSPNIMTISDNGPSPETITFNLTGQLTLTDGSSVSGFTSSAGAIASAIYSGAGTTNTITLTSGADGQWNGSTTISYSATAGNIQFLPATGLGKMQSIVNHSVAGFEVYTVPGVSSFTVPAGVTSITVEVWGAGGAGGSGTLSNYGGGSGGGGGGYSRWTNSVIPGTNIQVLVGQGGTPTAGFGNSGGYSYVNDPTYGYLGWAYGGSGGGPSGNGFNPGSPGYGYNFGYPGLFVTQGGQGGGGVSSGISSNTYSGAGGGSSAGTAGDGLVGTGSFFCTFCSSPGGGAVFGGGAGGYGAQSFSGGYGSFPGGGGGGAGPSGYIAGGGADGQVKISYSTSGMTGTSDWDGDGSPFKFNKIIFTQGTSNNNTYFSDWTTVIAGAELSDGTASLNSTDNASNFTFGPTSITVKNIPAGNIAGSADLGYVTDATNATSSKTYTLKVWLRTDMPATQAANADGKNLEFALDAATNLTYDDVTINAQKSSRLVSPEPSFNSGTSQVQVVASKLAFQTPGSTIPNRDPQTSIGVNIPFSSSSTQVPEVYALDAYNNLDLDYEKASGNTATITNTLSYTQSVGSPVYFADGKLSLSSFYFTSGASAAGNTKIVVTGSGLPAVTPATSGNVWPVISGATTITANLGTTNEPPSFPSLTTFLTGATGVQQNAVQNFDFTVTDDVGANTSTFADNDQLPTRINSITIRQNTNNGTIQGGATFDNWTNSIAGAALYYGTTQVPATVTINNSDITFSGIPNSPHVNAYVASSNGNALEIVNVANPPFPVQRGVLTTAGGGIFSAPRSLAVSGNYAFITNLSGSSLEIVDISNPAAPVHAANLVNGGGGGAVLSNPTSVTVSGNYAYVTNQTGNTLEIVNIANPTTPVHVGNAAVPSSPQNVVVRGKYAYVACNGGVFEIVDVSTPSVPVHAGSVSITSAFSVYLVGDYAYVVSNNKFSVVNISDPTTPFVVGTLLDGGSVAPFLSGARSIVVSGNYAYVAVTSDNALEIIDISNPAAPVHAGSLQSINTPGNLLLTPVWVNVFGNYAYVASFGSDALEIVDVSNPATPVHAGVLQNTAAGSPLDGAFTSLVSNSISGDEGFIPDGGSKTYSLKIWLKNPVDPTLQDIIDNEDFVFEINNASDFATTSPSSAISTITAFNSGDGNNKVSVDATQLDFTNQWALNANQYYDAALDADAVTGGVQSPVAKARDANQSLDRDWNTGNGKSGSVATSVPGTYTMANTAVTLTNGVFTFNPSLQVTSTGGGADLANPYLVLTSAGLSNGNSNSFVLNYSKASDIVKDATFIHGAPGVNTYTQNILYANYQSAAFSSSTSPSTIGVALERFKIQDGGASHSDLDGTPTKIQSIKLNITNGGNLRQVALYNGTTMLVELPVAAPYYDSNTGDMTFSSLTTPFATPVNGDGFLTVYATFKAVVTDNDVIQVKIASVTSPAASSYFAPAGASTNFAALGTDDNQIEVVATRLDITTPATATGASLSSDFPGGGTYVTVQARDANTSLDKDFAGTITAFSTVSGASTVNGPVVGTSVFGAANTPPNPPGTYNFPTNFQFTTGNNGDDVSLIIKAGTGTTCGSGAICADPTVPVGTSPLITLQTSFESSIQMDPNYTPLPTTIPYLTHTATGTDYPLIHLLLVDGSRSSTSRYVNSPTNQPLLNFSNTNSGDGKVNGDIDGATTNLTSLSVMISNPSALESLGLADKTGAVVATIPGLNYTVGTPPQLFTFSTGGTMISAPDDSSAVFSIVARFKKTFPQLQDGQNIQIQLVGTTLGTGSKYFNGKPANSGTAGPYLGGQSNSGSSSKPGTITTTNGSTSVSGIGTVFMSDLTIGSVIKDVSGNIVGTVASILNNISLTLTAAADANYNGNYGVVTTTNTNYNSGNITVTSGSSVVTGTGAPFSTKFTTELVPGVTIKDALGNVIGTVSTISSNTSLTLKAFASASYSGNYSSVTDSKTGTISVTSGSNTVTGTSTSFSSELAIGSVLKDASNNVIGTVSAIAGTNLTLTANATATYSGSYTALQTNPQSLGLIDVVATSLDFTVQPAPSPSTTSTAGVKEALGNNSVPTGSIVGGTGYTDGTYYGVTLTTTSLTVKSLPIVDITVSGGKVTNLNAVALPQDNGTSTFTCPASSIGGTGSGWSVTVKSTPYSFGSSGTLTSMPTTFAPVVSARDINALIDTDFAPASISLTDGSNNPLTMAATTSFKHGVMDLNGVQYTVASGGNGAIKVATTTPNLTSPATISGNATPSQTVYVDDVTVTVDATGVVLPTSGTTPPSANLKGGTPGVAIFGLKFTPSTPAGTSPSLLSFTIGFKNGVTGSSQPYDDGSTIIFTNPHVYMDGLTNDITTSFPGSTVAKQASTTAGHYDEYKVTLVGGQSLSASHSFFLKVDVSASTNTGTPAIMPFFKDLGYGDASDQHTVVSNGTAHGQFDGNQYSFASTKPPVLRADKKIYPNTTTSPYAGQNNVDPGITTITLEFDTNVGSLDGGGHGNFELWNRTTNKWVADLRLDSTILVTPAPPLIPTTPQQIAQVDQTNNTISQIYSKLIFDITNRDPSETPLKNDEVYFVKIIQGSFDANTKVGHGIADFGLNFYGGISSNSTLYFKVSSSIPPVLLGAQSNFNTQSVGTLATSFDKLGKAYYLILPTGTTPVPTVSQVLNQGTYTAVTPAAQGNFDITIVGNPASATKTYQTYTFPATFTAGSQYDVYLFAQNDAQPAPIPAATAIPTPSLYGSDFKSVQNGLTYDGLPTLKITNVSGAPTQKTPYATSYSLCPDSYITITEPMLVAETGVVNFTKGTDQDFNIVLPTGFEFDVSVPPTIDLIGEGPANAGNFKSLLTATPINYKRIASTNGVSNWEYKYVSNSVLNIRFYNNNVGGDFQDYISISGLSIRGKTGAAQDHIQWFYGSNVFTNPAYFDLATIGVATSAVPDFTNSFWSANQPFPLLPTGDVNYNNVLNAFTKTVNAIPDNYQESGNPGQVRLLPITPPTSSTNTFAPGDFLSSVFSGSGVSGDLLTLSAVTTGAAFNIDMSHTDLNGCATTRTEQYVVYDHNSPISKKLGITLNGSTDEVTNLAAQAGTKQDIVNSNFFNTPTNLASPILSPVLANNEVAGYKLLQLTVDLPYSELALNKIGRGSQLMTGTAWHNWIKRRILTGTGTTQPYSPPYSWDYSYVLNADTSNNATSGPINLVNVVNSIGGLYVSANADVTTANPVNPTFTNVYDYYKSTPNSNIPLNRNTYYPNGNNYWTGGSLGKIEYTGIYNSTADAAVFVPFRQGVELYVPPIPLIEVTSPNLSKFDNSAAELSAAARPNFNSVQYPAGYNGTSVFCEQGGSIALAGYPAATAGKSSGTFEIYDLQTYKTWEASAPVAGTGTISYSYGSNIVTASGSPFTTSWIGATLYDNSNKPIGVIASYTAGNSVKLSNWATGAGTNVSYNVKFPATALSHAGTSFLDNKNGTMTLNPAAITNNYQDILVTYTYQESTSPAVGVGNLVIRVTPNPVAKFTIASTVGNPGSSTFDAFCVGSPIQFDAGTSTIGGQLNDTSKPNYVKNYAWVFGDPNSGNANAPKSIDPVNVGFYLAGGPSNTTIYQGSNPSYPNNYVQLNASTSQTYDKPVHIFNVSSAYTVDLTLTSNWGCSSLPVPATPFPQTPNSNVLYAGSSGAITVGEIPIPDFSVVNSCAGDLISFNASASNMPSGVSSNSQINKYNWDYNYQIPVNGLPNPTPATSSLSAPTGAQTTYLLTAPGFYNVQLTTVTTLKCQAPKLSYISQLPIVSAFNNNFDSNDGSWQALDLSTTPPTPGANSTNASWAWGTTSGRANTVFNSASANKLWSTSSPRSSTNGSYYPKEKSALYSGCLDLNPLTVPRPMISYSSFVDVNTGDGLVLQYSIDNLNVLDPQKVWTNLGSISTGASPGIDWYNLVGLPSNPGNTGPTTPNAIGTGWTGNGKAWIHPKHSLDAVAKIAGTQKVILRFAFSSVAGSTINTSTNTGFDGVAIDSVFFGSRTRTILFENFTSTDGGTGTTLSSEIKVDNDSIRAFVQRNINTTQLVDINYHVGFVGNDPFAIDNASDPGARALFYGVKQIPFAFLDGQHYRSTANPLPTNPDLFKYWGQAEYDLNTLQLAKADFDDLATTRTLVTPVAGGLKIDVNFKPLVDNMPIGVGGTTLHVAVLEKSVTGVPSYGQVSTSESSFEYVLKQLLPSAVGTQFTTPLKGPTRATPTSPLVYYPVNAGTFYYTPRNMHSTTLTVVVFLQNETTKEVYQAHLIDNIVANVVTAVEPTAENIKLYPNPADQELTVELPSAVKEKTALRLANQWGQYTEMADFNEGEWKKTISTRDLAEGVYILQLGSGNSAVRSKVVVIHK